MAQATKVVKGGLRATLALIISIIALILSFLSYSSIGMEEDLRSKIKELQNTIDVMKQETLKKMDMMRMDMMHNETVDMLVKLGKKLKMEEEQQ